MKKVLLGLVGAFVITVASAAVSKNYVDFTQKAFNQSATQKRVLFFAASWCPSCRGADKDITANLSKIPANVTVFKTDYDTETALKSKYGITRQHTFVYVNAKGTEVKKWSGGGAAEIVLNTK